MPLVPFVLLNLSCSSTPTHFVCISLITYFQHMRVHIKSQFGAEFRRYSIVVGTGLPEPTIEEFISELFDVHK